MAVLLEADDFVGVSNSEEELQRLMNVAHAKWRLRANVSKSAVVVFARELVEGFWNWGEQDYRSIQYLLRCYFTSNGAWDEHVKRVLQNAGKRLVKCIDLTARRLLLISVVRPTLEYGSEVWEGNKAQAAALESVMIGVSLEGPVMRLLEVTWGWIHYRVVEIRRS